MVPGRLYTIASIPMYHQNKSSKSSRESDITAGSFSAMRKMVVKKQAGREANVGDSIHHPPKRRQRRG